jgi:tetratricopeptide (TPR) repeat protein
MPDDKPTSHRIFISYAQVDGKKFAERLHDDLEHAGIPAFLDERDIGYGQNIDLVVRSNLMNARAVLAVLTPGAALSDFVGGELFSAYEDSLPVIPLLFEEGGTSPSEAVLKTLDFQDYEATFPVLLQALATLDRDWSEYLRIKLALTIEQQSKSPEPKRFEVKIERLKRFLANRSGGLDSSAPVDSPPAPARQAVATGARPQLAGAPLPDISTHFRDRQSQIRELRALLTARETRIVTIQGRGGIGKTALAAHVLREPEGEQPFRGVASLSARTGEITLEAIFTTLGSLLDENARTRLAEAWTKSYLDIPGKTAVLLKELAGGNYVLLLDNLESLLDRSRRFIDDGLMAFTEACVAVKSTLVILVTTRVPLALRKELLIFDRQVRISVGLPERDAITMLRDLDANGRSGLQRVGDERLGEIVRLTKGLPRALELVAYLLANDPLLSFQDLLDPGKFFRGEDVMQELVAGAYSRVDQDALAVLQALAVLGRMVPQVAVESLLDAPRRAGIRDTLRYLVQTYVVSFNRDMATFDLHPLDRDYLSRSLPSTGEYSSQTLNQRAADYYAQARKPESEWKSPSDLTQLFEFQHRLLAGQADEAARLLASIDENYLEVWGYNQRLVRMRRELAEKLTSSGPRVQNLVKWARAEHRLGHFETAIDLSWQGRKIAHDAGDPKGEAICLNYIGNNYYFLGRYTRSLEKQTEALALVGDDRRREAACLSAMGNAYNQISEYQKSLDAHERALAIRRELKNSRWISDSLQNLGELYYNMGELERALKDYNEKLDASAGSGQWSDELTRLTNGAAILIEYGRFEEAKRDLERAGFLMHHSMEWRWEDVQASMSGDIARALGDYQAAEKAYQTALDLATHMNSRSKQIRHLVGLAQVRRLREDLAGAAMFLRQALESAVDTEDATRQIAGRNELALVHLLSGNAAEAARVMADAFAREVPLHQHRAFLLRGLAAVDRSAAALDLEEARSRAEELLQQSADFVAAGITRAVALAGKDLLTPDSGPPNAEALDQWRRIAERTVAAPGLRKEVAQLRRLVAPLDTSKRIERFSL